LTEILALIQISLQTCSISADDWVSETNAKRVIHSAPAVTWSDAMAADAQS